MLESTLFCLITEGVTPLGNFVNLLTWVEINVNVIWVFSALCHRQGGYGASLSSNPTPTLTLPLKGRETELFLPIQGGGQEGDGVFVGPVIEPVTEA